MSGYGCVSVCELYFIRTSLVECHQSFLIVESIIPSMSIITLPHTHIHSQMLQLKSSSSHCLQPRVYEHKANKQFTKEKRTFFVVVVGPRNKGKSTQLVIGHVFDGGLARGILLKFFRRTQLFGLKIMRTMIPCARRIYFILSSPHSHKICFFFGVNSQRILGMNLSRKKTFQHSFIVGKRSQ